MTIPTGNLYDSGNYPAVLERALQIPADFSNGIFEADNQQSPVKGRIARQLSRSSCE
ncbi:hypothetical protein [Bradyrhizobium sp. Gha]|uniref:hypothetical protein n=1 Tax=Bradyrhizobium sp. Gha TaxID=1855318 RepID=UPI000A9F72D4|nr:hypothetical protein [Bradyrhizobium sp. Gha]